MSKKWKWIIGLLFVGVVLGGALGKVRISGEILLG